ncbi:O-antigen ligase family protein [Adhaeribacter arboris]|uniref:O-antigen ligase family protein n=1 Tax=Adhaeribacter arboris TaxID=2072846 RepID=UPI0011B25CCD|nr:O-antigen ligase family protein [Adhaeribacter arboris]
MPLAIIVAIITGWLTVKVGLALPLVLVGLVVAIAFATTVFVRPKIGFMAYIVYCFIITVILRNATSPPPIGPLMDGLLLLSCVAVAFNRYKYQWSNLRNDHFLLAFVWFLINLIEVVNPAGASIIGWLQEMRFTSLNWLLIALLSSVLFTQKKDLDLFLKIVLGLSIIATFYGMKQLYIGLTTGEQRWLDAGADLTHIVFGKLRVFSMFTDAGQFGASQAHLGLVALILALGPFKWWKKVILGLVAGILLYGMLISGTRGALFALVVGVFVALFLSKQTKTLIVGCVLALSALYVLKYTTIGNSYSYHIVRLRTALDPEDISLNVRFNNQQKLKKYLADLPFGGGVGVSGMNGNLYNADKFLSKIPPDSYWVKVWVMYGVVGLVIWFGIIMYILGKCSGIVWNIKDPKLRVKLIALTAGTAGVFVCSYGNEVINGIPTAMIVYISWAFVFLGPKLDSES